MTSRDFKFEHQSVLLSESVALLAVRPDGTYIDCTAGGGGHSAAILALLGGQGHLIAMDKDPDAVHETQQRLDRIDSPAHREVIHEDFTGLSGVMDRFGLDRVDGILADLGVSSPQLDRPERGFSYAADGPLDMRMNPTVSMTATQVIATYPEERLESVFRQYGEERYARRIAAAICRRREQRPFGTTADLADTVSAAMPPRARREAQHPARRVFQALRIEVNGELDALRELLSTAAGRLSDGGRICVISFHSLEDRMVKDAFRTWENPCTCPRDFPQCVCGAVSLGRVLTRKAVVASPEEEQANPRARSARLRAFERSWQQ